MPLPVFTPTSAEVRATLRGLLREVNKQYTARNNNTLWRDEVMKAYRERPSHPVGSEASPEIITARREAVDLLTYLRATREHKRLSELYWPTTQLSAEEKVHKTANFVGLAMPKDLTADEVERFERRRDGLEESEPAEDLDATTVNAAKIVEEAAKLSS